MNGNGIIRSRAYLLDRPNIDTDQIIPARFLTTTTRQGLGAHAFSEWRFDAQGRPRADCPLNDPGLAGAGIIVAGNNFGCGSSREHAAWALRDLGIRAVVSTQVADIFKSNALRNGIAPVVVGEAAHTWLRAHAEAEIVIDLRTRRIGCEGRSFGFEIDPFGRRCLIEGIDDFGWLMNHERQIHAYEERVGWTH